MQKQVEQKKLILFDDSEENDKMLSIYPTYSLELKNKLKNQSMMRNMLEN